MSNTLRGNTIGRYGNPYHSQTLAGGTLIFYRFSEEKADLPRPRWGWNPAERDSIEAEEIGRVKVGDDGAYELELKDFGRGPLLVALDVEKFSYAPDTGKSAFGILGVAALDDKKRDDEDDEAQQARQLDIELNKVSYCSILKRLGLWLVAGRVSDCADVDSPLIGGLVEAFDRDVTQDDFLGKDTTDSTGSFSIFFGSETFKGIPTLPPPFDLIPPHELFGGPDVFFRISQGSTILLEEPPSRGRDTGRENVPNCSFHPFCVKAPLWTPQAVTLWSAIGNYKVPNSGGLKDFDAEGFVASGKLAFTGNIEFTGQLSQTFKGQPVSYRFVHAEWPSDLTTAPSYPADYQPLLGGNLNLGRKYGSIYVSTGPAPWDFDLTDVLPAPDPVTGWIAVDQSSNFVRDTDVLVQVKTGTLVPPVGPGNMEGTSGAGDPVPAGPLRDRPRKFSFVLEIKTSALSAHQPVPVPIHINNSLVFMRYNLTELETDACTAITSAGGSITVHPKYTVAHPYLQYYRMNVQRQGGTNLVVKEEQHSTHGSLWTSATGEHGTETAVYTDVGKCSYRSSLVADRRLTNGHGGVSHQNILRTFCVD